MFNFVFRKALVINTIVLFVFSILTPISLSQTSSFNDTNLLKTYLGNTLYVGGNGPNNYSSIQSAIDDANNRDTVVVYNGTYHENIIINKSLSLLGEEKATTIIDGNGSRNVITIISEYVYIEGFKICNSGSYNPNSGILLAMMM